MMEVDVELVVVEKEVEEEEEEGAEPSHILEAVLCQQLRLQLDAAS